MKRTSSVDWFQAHWFTFAWTVGWLASLAGYLSFGSLLWAGVQADGGLGYDFHSYWLGAQHALLARPLYHDVEINDRGAYRYLPIFAVLLAPMALLPELVATWIYRAICVLCIWYLVGSWRAVGWCLLLPPVTIELMALNVTLPVATVTRRALLGSQPEMLFPAAALRYGPIFSVAYVFTRIPFARRRLLIGAAVTAGIVLCHFVVAPSLWIAFLTSLVQQASAPNDAPYVANQLVFLVPATLGDFMVRLVICAVLLVVAIHQKWPWLAFAASTVSVPTLWLARLAPLVAIPRMWRESGSPGMRHLRTATDRIWRSCLPPSSQ